MERKNIVVVLTVVLFFLMIDTRDVSSPFNDIGPAPVDITLFTSTYIGGTSIDTGRSIEIDNYGNIWLIGASHSVDYPITRYGTEDQSHNSLGYSDIVLTLLPSSADKLKFSTFFGGDGFDYPTDTCFDKFGNLWMIGVTSSKNFPIMGSAINNTYGGVNALEGWNDGFICKMSAITNTILYSTYIASGPYPNFDALDLTACTIDGDNNLWVVGYTGSETFPISPNAFDPNIAYYDGLILKLSPDGSELLYSTFFGGSNYDIINDIAIDNSGRIWITGYTKSAADFPLTTTNAFDTTHNGGIDAFITCLDFSQPSPLIYSSFLGGMSDDQGNSITIGDNDFIYVVGDSTSSDFPVTYNAYDSVNPSGSDIFLSVLDPTVGVLYYSTYIGGSSDDFGHNHLIDHGSNIWITGTTHSTDFPVSFKPVDSLHNGWKDAYLVKMSPSGEDLSYSTFLGGPYDDLGFDLVYSPSETMLWMIGDGKDAFITTPYAINSSYNGMGDIVAVAINDTAQKEILTTSIENTNTSESKVTSETIGTSILSFSIVLLIAIYRLGKKKKKKDIR